MDHEPTVWPIEWGELLEFCSSAGYRCRLEPAGSLLIPPDYNVGMTDWEKSLKLRKGEFSVLGAEPALASSQRAAEEQQQQQEQQQREAAAIVSASAASGKPAPDGDSPWPMHGERAAAQPACEDGARLPARLRVLFAPLRVLSEPFPPNSCRRLFPARRRCRGGARSPPGLRRHRQPDRHRRGAGGGQGPAGAPVPLRVRAPPPLNPPPPSDNTQFCRGRRRGRGGHRSPARHPPPALPAGFDSPSSVLPMRPLSRFACPGCPASFEHTTNRTH